MLKKIIFTTIVLMLVACSAPPIQTQVTVTSQATVTITPPPTTTIIPTPTLSPEFLAIQEQVAGEAQNYKIIQDGNVEGTKGVIPGIKLDPDGRSYTIMVNGAPVVIEANKVSITDDGINIEGYSHDSANGEFDEIVTYTPEQIKGMTDVEIVDKAPHVKGLDMRISPAGKHIVLYSNAEGKIEQAYNMLTKEMVDVIHVSTDPENRTKLTMDKITSREWADSERLQCPGFSPNAIPGKWLIKLESRSTESVGMYRNPEYAIDPSARPQVLCSFGELDIDLGRGEKPYIVLGIAILNADGTTSFIHQPVRPEDLEIMLEAMNDRQNEIVTELIKKYANYPEEDKIIEKTPDIKEWAEQLVATGNIPAEMEKILILTSGGKW